MNSKDYIKVFINDFHEDKINMKKLSDDKFIIQYDRKPFYIVSEDKFNTFGIKSINSINKITLIFDNKNNYHNKYKKIINDIYKKVKKYINDNLSDIDVINPLGEKNYTLDIDVYKSKYNTSTFFEVNNNNLISINIHDINRSFSISPIIFLYQLIIVNKKLYFNYVIQEAYIQFEEPIMPKEFVLNIFNNKIKYSRDNKKDDNEYCF